MRKTMAMVAMLGLLVLAVGLPVHAGDQSAGSTVGKPYGLTYGQWGALWWQWALSTSEADNPVLDTTGEDAHRNQFGPVFFLAGTFGPYYLPEGVTYPVIRDVTVSSKKAFFLPLTNWVLTSPEDSWAIDWYNGENPDARPQLKKLNANAMQIILDWWLYTYGNLDYLLCEVDGVAVQGERGQSDAFPLYMPPGSIEVTLWGYAEGWHYPNMSDGMWVMLAPLPAGEHTIHIQNGPPDNLYVEVIYNLTVVEE